MDKKGKRKWCSMSVCGNRVKARKHYDKNKLV
ncbi:CGNR zinc finger domain-containing protein [Halobacillus halophilus]